MQYVHIVEGHWGTPTDMDPHNKQRFFDGTIVLHQHLDQLSAKGTTSERVAARTRVTFLRAPDPSLSDHNFSVRPASSVEAFN